MLSEPKTQMAHPTAYEMGSSRIDEANEMTPVRLTGKRRDAKIGDIFRLSPQAGVYLWGRLIKKARFLGDGFGANLVYIYDRAQQSQSW